MKAVSEMARASPLLGLPCTGWFRCALGGFLDETAAWPYPLSRPGIPGKWLVLRRRRSSVDHLDRALAAGASTGLATRLGLRSGLATLRNGIRRDIFDLYCAALVIPLLLGRECLSLWVNGALFRSQSANGRGYRRSLGALTHPTRCVQW